MAEAESGVLRAKLAKAEATSATLSERVAIGEAAVVAATVEDARLIYERAQLEYRSRHAEKARTAPTAGPHRAPMSRGSACRRRIDPELILCSLR